MSQVSDVILAGDVTKALQAVLDRLVELRRHIKDRVLVGDRSGLSVQTRTQAIFGERFVNVHEQRLFEVVLGHATSAESLGPGGFDRCIESLLKKIERFRDGDNTVFILGDSGDIVGPGALRASEADIDAIISSHASGLTLAMLRQALTLAGFAGRVFVERARSEPSVELIRGYSFALSPAWPINGQLANPRVICIDGYVEHVSELHHFLEEAAESKESVIVFVRGLSADVLNTLRVNNDRGSLRVIPVIVRYDLEGINTLNDVCVVAGASLLASNKGDLISAVRLASAPQVSSVIMGPSRTIIVNDVTHQSVQAHVAFLRDKRTTVIDDVASLLDARIRSLSPNQVVIRLPDDRDFVASSQAIDNSLRAIRSLVDHGTVVVNGERMLTSAAIAAEIHSSRCLSALLSVAASVQLALPCQSAQPGSGT